MPLGMSVLDFPITLSLCSRCGHGPSPQLTLQVLPVIRPDGIILRSEQIIRFGSLLTLPILLGVDLSQQVQSMARPYLLHITKRDKLQHKLAYFRKRRLCFSQDSTQIIPRTLVLRRQPNGFLRKPVISSASSSLSLALPQRRRLIKPLT